jgi:hypothetical protein
MAGIPKISNPFEDETDFVDSVTVSDVVKQGAQATGNAAMKNVVKPVVNQVAAVTDQSITDFLYGVDTSSASTDSTGDQTAAAGAAGTPDAGIEQIAQGAQTNPQQTSKMQQIMDPDQKMAKSEKAQLSEEQLDEREKARLHQRNYFTMGNKLDDIGFLEEQIAKVRQQKEQEEQERRQEEEEEEQRKKQEEEEKKQQLAPPSGKKTGVPEAVLKREQNKAENKTGFSG